MNTQDKRQFIRMVVIRSLTEKGIAETARGIEDCSVYAPVAYIWNAVTDASKWIKVNTRQYDATMVIVELEASGNAPAVKYNDIINLLSLIHDLRKGGRKIYICFRQDCNKNKNDYYRLSAFLNLWAVQTGMYNDIRFYNKSDKSQMVAQSLAARQPKGRDFTAYVSKDLVPIIAVTAESQKIIESEYSLPDDTRKVEMARVLSRLREIQDNDQAVVSNLIDTSKYLNAYLYAYIEKSTANIPNKIKNFWDEFIRNYHPPILVVAILSTVLNSMPQSDIDALIPDDINVGQSGCKEREWISLIERCYSYSQGILQLIDNAYKHVVGKRRENGAFLGFYIRQDKENILNKVKDKKNLSLEKCNRFLQVYVVDFDNAPIEQGEIKPHVGIVAQYNRTLEKAGVQERIKSLGDIFDYPNENSVALDAYYDSIDNLAFHYGLQIFSDVVLAGKGALTVVSGAKSGYSDEVNAMSYAIDEVNYSTSRQLYHFAGTSYNIILPMVALGTEQRRFNFLLDNEHIFSNDIKLDICAKNLLFYVDVNKNAAQYFDGYNKAPIVNVNLNEKNNRHEIELICKSALVEFVKIVESGIGTEAKVLCFTGFPNEYAILDAVRVISLFYNRYGVFDKIKGRGIFLHCRRDDVDSKKNADYELYFSGTNWRSVRRNIERQTLIRNIPEFFTRAVDAIKCNYNNISSSKREENVLPAAIVKYFLYSRDGESIIQQQLRDILRADVHKPPLGCKISDTHVRIGKVHLDTFYEAQFLFGNAYCTDIFALYIADRIKNTLIRGGYRNVILYGYETYSTLTMYKAKNFLQMFPDDVHMLVYEKSNERVRYLDSRLFDKNSDKQKTLVVYVMGISSTLSTFKQMNRAFNDACSEGNIKADHMDNLCLSVIQIDGQGSERFITRDDDKINNNGIIVRAYSSVLNYLDFALNKKAYYYISAPSRWYAAEEEVCPCCFPESAERKDFEELPLIEVDDTSVVPSQMIFLHERSSKEDSCKDSGRDNANTFLSSVENSKYLRYGHLERYDNHFQYFFRLAQLYHDKQEDIERWLEEIRDQFFNKDTISEQDGQVVNILIAPQHFSNTGFVNSVSGCVFDNKAHIIELDIRKEYRSNFRTKYSNYRELAEFMSSQPGYNLKFYYVNDQIITGRTFKRAESLINSLLGKCKKNRVEKYNEDQTEKFNNDQNWKIFDGVFTLVDRNSDDTRASYVDKIVPHGGNGKGEHLPFFSYLRFDIPSLRNHDNSCPLCNQISAIKDIVKAAAFTSTAHYWQEKIVYHSQRTSDEARKIDNKLKRLSDEAQKTNSKLQQSEDEYTKKRKRNFRRLKCENDLWNRLRNCIYSDEAYKEIIKAFKIIVFAERKDSDSFLYSEDDLFKWIIKLSSRAPKIFFDLYKTVITRLCAIGSCYLLRYKNIIKCLQLGNALEAASSAAQDNASADEIEKVENIISYLKVMSRPLLFYREPVKRAVIELLIKLLNNMSAIEIPISLNPSSKRKEWYDTTFNGFMLNAIKRLLCYDKGHSKSYYCDMFAFTEEKNEYKIPKFDKEFYDFFLRLFIENNRIAFDACRERIRKENESKQHHKAELLIFNQDRIATFDRQGDISAKYGYITERLNKICLNKEGRNGIAFFIADEKSGPYIWIGGDKSIGESAVKGGDAMARKLLIDNMKDIHPSDGDGIYYIEIGNNYRRFNDEEKNSIYHYCERLGLMQDACVVMGVRTDDIGGLRNIIAFRKEILREAEKDFNNGTVGELLSTKQMAEMLTREAYVSHVNDPRKPYIANIISASDSLRLGDSLNLSCDNKEAFRRSQYEIIYSVIDSYMEAMIPMLYKDLIKRNMDVVSVEKDGVTVKNIPEHYPRSSAYIKYDQTANKRIDASPSVQFALDMLRLKYGSDIGVFYRVNSHSESDRTMTVEIAKEEFLQYKYVGWFVGNILDEIGDRPESHFEPFMIINTLIKNAYKYVGENIKVIFDKKDDGNIDLIVENKYNKDDGRGRGMTLKALGNYFGTDSTSNEPTNIDWDKNEELRFFQVTIAGFFRLKK